MKNNNVYHNFYKRWEEVVDLPTQTLGPLTPLYKKTIPYLKNAPWRILIPIAFILVSTAVLFHEVTAPQIASFLQRGF